MTIQVYLTNAETRPISTEEFVQKWRQKTGTIPGLETVLFLSDKGGPGIGNSDVTMTRRGESLGLRE